MTNNADLYGTTSSSATPANRLRAAERQVKHLEHELSIFERYGSPPTLTRVARERLEATKAEIRQLGGAE